MEGCTRARLPLLVAAVALLFGTAPAWGHDMSINTVFDCVGPGACEQSGEHEDADPFKGWILLTVQNTGTEPWGDFHFELFQVTDPIDNVFFDVASPNEPTSSQSGLSWSVSGGGHVIDLFFYGDPVDPGEIATFNVYTDNTTEPRASFFGTQFYPTPIPEPGSFGLLGAGLLGLAGLRRRSASRRKKLG